MDASLAKREAWGEVSALRCIAKACMFCRQSRQIAKQFAVRFYKFRSKDGPRKVKSNQAAGSDRGGLI